jgi:RNA polymerase sigma factor (sigma-70 family)
VSNETPPRIDQHKQVRAALPLVEKHARHFEREYGRLVEGDDLRTVGKLALYAAARRFDEKRVTVPRADETGMSGFEVFASFRIKGAMRNAVKAETKQERIKKEMDRAFYNRMAEYTDDFDILRHDQPEFQRRLDVMCQHALSAMFYAGAEQARREDEHDAETALAYAESLATLRVLVLALKPDERQVLDLVYGHGFNLDDAADAMNVARVTAWRRLHRVLESLRREFEAIGLTDMPVPVKLSRPPLCLVRPPPVGSGGTR